MTNREIGHNGVGDRRFTLRQAEFPVRVLLYALAKPLVPWGPKRALERAVLWNPESVALSRPGLFTHSETLATLT